ncbi:MAG TPA: ABC transporter permease [Myxococcales bacterium]|jgi:predicted permease|nr:ABC transporter permease [Myxococcales bacterium]
MDDLIRDLRLALRGLARTPAFTIAAILTLALGIGATTALFSVVNAVLLRSMGWGEESRLVIVKLSFEAQGISGNWISAPEYLDLRRSPVFQSIGVTTDRTAALQGDQAESVRTGYATGSFFQALGVQPLYGRVFEEAEDTQGNDNAVMISYAAFHKRYGGDPRLVGQSITVDGRPRTVIGVLPEQFRWNVPNELWVPFGFSAKELSSQRGNHYLEAIGRLAPGVTAESARAGISTLAAELRAAHPDFYPKEARWTMGLEPLRDRFVGAARAPLYLLFGAVLLVLLIACGNVANLLLARGAARAREVAVRSALGASRARLVRQLLTESALLAVAGTAAGVLVAGWSLQALLATAPALVRSLTDVALDRAVLGFAAALSIVTTFVFGLLPALHSSRADLRTALQSFVGPRAGRVRAALVVVQVSLSIVLLIGAGLMLRSFARLLDVPAGFDPQGVIAARVSLGGPNYATDEQQAAYWTEAIRRASAVPGVSVAGASNVPPLEGRTDWSYTVEGYQPKPGEPGLDDEFRRVTPGYFAALRIPLLHGREIGPGDDAKAPFVLLVNDAWVRRFFPGQDVLGKRIRFGDEKSPWHTIVGVSGDAHEWGLDKPTPPALYAAQAQVPDETLTLLARASPSAMEPLRRALAGLDATQPVDFVQLYETRIGQALAPRRFPLQLFATFAALALILSAVGIYGVTAYGVTQRTREIGVRIAIGATSTEVVRMVLRSAVRLAALGVAIGLCAALILARFLESQLFGVSARDPLTYATISAILALVALGASFLPALKAARTDPMTALRSE